jgi:membrane protein implicated in regulation of membrane protease activity
MDKNDKLKEELAESRHVEIMTVGLAALGFAGAAIAIAYGIQVGWQLSLSMWGILAVGWGTLYYLARRNSRKRSEKIKQLDNQEQPSKPQTSTS